MAEKESISGICATCSRIRRGESWTKEKVPVGKETEYKVYSRTFCHGCQPEAPKKEKS